MTTEHHTIGGTGVEIRWKAIRNLHVGVYPPDGHVRVSAPEGIGLDAIRLAILTRMPWIRRKQAQFAAQERQSPRLYVSGETHFVFGRPYRLETVLQDGTGYRIARQPNDRLVFTIPGDTEVADRHARMEAWRKSELRGFAGPRIAFWSDRLGVRPAKWGIRSMRTKWGSCNPDRKTVWLNTELSKKPERMIDYVVIHELAHLISSRHDRRFIAVLDREMKNWRQIRTELNALPLPSP